MANNCGGIQKSLVLVDNGSGRQQLVAAAPGQTVDNCRPALALAATPTTTTTTPTTPTTPTVANGKQQIDLLGARQRRCSCGRVLNFSPTNQTMSSASSVPSPQSKEKTEQMSKLTKWLCAIILALVLVVLVLILLDAPYRWYGSSSASAHLQRQNLSAFAQLKGLTNSLTLSERNSLIQNKITEQPHQAGKLLASSSDDHYTSAPLDDHASSSGDDHYSDMLDGHDDDNSNDNKNDHSDNNSKSNQILKDFDDQPNRHNTAARQRQHQHHHHHQQQQPRGPNTNKAIRDPPPEAVCMTPGCVRAAAQVLNNMDSTTKPCDDFYQFACGRWISTQVIPDEKTSLSVFSQNTADLNIKLRALIERPERPEDPPIVGQMRNLYASCMNLSDIEARGDEPLLEVLRFFGGWPVLSVKTGDSLTATILAPISATQRRRRNDPARQQTTPNGGAVLARRRAARAATGGTIALDTTTASTNSNPTSSSSSISPSTDQFSWLETLIKFRQRGFSHDMIIDLSVVPDVRNNKRYIIELDQSSLGLPDRAYYFKGMNDSTVSAYHNLMVESAVMLGAPRNEARKQMTEVLEFETSLAKISAPREQRRNITRLYNKMLARDLFKLAPNIDWKRYLGSLLKDSQLDLEEDEVIVKVPAFLQALDSLLIKTEPRIVANYMMWRVVRHSMNGLTKKWRELAHSYSTVTTGRQVEEPRWEQCLGSLDGTLGTALSAFYVKNHFNERSKASALEMVDYIREEFLRILNEIDWMDEETREEARNKAKAISAYIGYPDELLQDELVEELYSGVKMSRLNFYQNVRDLRIWSTDYAFSQLRKPNKRGDWKKHARAAVVNAYYNSLENSIEFPAGILQGAFFDADRPNYMNFGAIGYVIGHEITHGFDDRGRQFDSGGNDRNWWKPKTDARFRERAQCIVEQYGNYTVQENGLRVNGVNTQGENIADNGGIKEAFRAYRRWTKDNGREQRLPGLSSFTPDQLFWISAANIWCGKFRPEVLKLRVNSGVHSPARFRIIGPLSNSPEFSQSFGCPLGSPMNPNKKCSVW